MASIRTCTFLAALLGPLAAGALAQTHSWKTLRVGGAGFVSGLVASRTVPNLIYARTDVGGAYRWNETADSWESITDWSIDPGDQGVSSIALDPRNPNRVYMVTGISYFNGGRTAFLRSDDRGETFEKVDVTTLFKVNGNGTGRHLGERLAVDPNLSTRLIAGGGNSLNGAFLTGDRGSTWTPITTLDRDGMVSFVAFDSGSSAAGSPTRIAYVGFARTGDRNLFRTDDAGATWTPITNLDTLAPQRGFVSEDGTLHVTFATSADLGRAGSGSVWKRTRAGVATSITPASRTIGYSGIHALPGDARQLIVSTINHYGTPQCWEGRACGWGSAAWGDVIFTSRDGGATWQNQTNGISNNKTVKLGLQPDGPLWIKEGNGNMHWTGSVVFDPFRPERAFVTSGNGVFASNSLSGTTPTTWYFTSKGIEEMVTNRMLVLPGGAIVTTIWDYTGFRNPAPDVYAPRMLGVSGGRNIALAMARRKPQFLARFGSSDTGSIAISRDTGHTWSLVERPVKVAGGDVTLNADATAMIWSRDSVVYRSTDLGATWSRVTWPGHANPEIHGDPIDPKLLYAYHASTGRVYASIDAGATFSLRDTLHAGASGNGIEPTFDRVGEFWIPTNGGQSADGWKRRLIRARINPATGAVSVVRNIDEATSGLQSVSIVGLGKAAPGRPHPSVFVWGRVAGVTGIYRSDDTGTSWIRVNDDRHQYGGPGNGQFVTGDPYVHGRVYMGTFGRGVVYGDIKPSVAVGDRPIPARVRTRATLQRRDEGWTLHVADPGPVRIWRLLPDGSRQELSRCDGPCEASLGDLGAGRGWIEVRTGLGREVLPYVSLDR